MRLFHHAWTMVLGALLLIAAAPAAAQNTDPAGSWVLIAEGRALALLELRRDPRAAGGWTGRWRRPQRLTITQSGLAFGISGPVTDRAIRSAAVRGSEIDFTVEASSPEGKPDVFTFRLTGPTHAEFGWQGNPIPPLPLIRAEAGTAVSADWNSEARYPLTTPRPSNPEMRAIFAADQAARSNPTGIDWSVVRREDEARRLRTQQLLDGGALQSGEDFFHAAFVFQHGSRPEHYLLAHSLAVIAAARGRPDATWIAAATLDRYLQSIDRGQIYGTQYSIPAGQPATQEPYDRTIVSDALRQAMGVPTQAQQEERRSEMEGRYRAREANPPQ